MKAATRATLADVADRLARAGVPIALGGSGLLWALSLVDDVADLDLLVPADCEEPTCAALEIAPDRVDHVGTALWASAWFATTTRGGVDIDLIGGLAVRADGRVVSLPWRVSGQVRIEGTPVALSDPALWWVVYRRYKPEKAALLETVLAPADLAAIRAELALDEGW